MSELEIKPENYYLDVLQNPDYYLTGEKPIYKKVIKEAYSREQVLKLLEPQLTIPESIADELKEAIGATNFESTPYSIKLDEDGYLMMWASLRNKKLSEKTYKFCRDNTRVFDAYLNPLTRDLVKVVEG